MIITANEVYYDPSVRPFVAFGELTRTSGRQDVPIADYVGPSGRRDAEETKYGT